MTKWRKKEVLCVSRSVWNVCSFKLFFLLLFISSIFLEVLNTQWRTSGEDYIFHFCCERTIDFLLNNVLLISSPLIGNATRMWKTAGQTMLKLGLTFWTHFFHHNSVYFDKFYLIIDTNVLLNKIQFADYTQFAFLTQLLYDNLHKQEIDWKVN